MDPQIRYKKCYVLPGGFIPGPKKPKNLESYLFPGLQHVSALQKEGLKVLDASTGTIVTKRPLVTFMTADAPGMAAISGEVSHCGANGCRKQCLVPWHLKPSSTHYYPSLKVPDGTANKVFDPGDVNLRTYSPYFVQETYDANLMSLLQTKINMEYEQERKRTGLCKPSIFSGMAVQCFGIPGGFPVDVMHLLSLNITDLLLSLWRGTMKCDKEDSKSTWDWVVLTGEAWKIHGAKVAQLHSNLPSSYERPPCNPAEKLNSGYKATEFNTYVYGFLPALLLETALPNKYYMHFLKLVRGVHIVLQKSILKEELFEAHELFIQFLEEFEDLYVQRKPTRIHFVRQCLYVLWHLVPETLRYGLTCNYAQWTIKRTIGNLGQEIRLHSNPYANLAKRGVLRAVINSLLIRYPSLDIGSQAPRGSVTMGSGAVLLRPCNEKSYELPVDEKHVLEKHFQLNMDENLPFSSIIWFGHLKLVNEQLAHSVMSEGHRPTG